MSEIWTNSGASFETFTVHNWDVAGGCGGGESCVNIWGCCTPTGFPGWDTTRYHRYAMRVTGNGSQVFVCGYVEDTPGVSGLVSMGCQQLPGPGTAQQLSGARMSGTPQFLVGESFGCSGSCATGQPFPVYIKSFSLWVCQGWQTNQVSGNGTTRCLTASANP